MKNKVEKLYVLYATDSYHDIIETCIKSIQEFSQIPILVYFLNSDTKIDLPNVTTIRWDCDIEGENENMYLMEESNFYINRDNSKINKILIQRPMVIRDALLNHAETVVYIDSDSVATPYIDNIFNMYDKNLSYPYFVEGVYDWLHKDGRGGAWSRDDLSTTLEHPICELFGINQYVRQRYRTTNLFIAGQNTIDFIEEWYWMCNHPKVIKNFEWYTPFHEETVANALLWKYNYLDGLPYVYTNCTAQELDKVFTEFYFPGYDQHIHDWFRLPAKEEELLVIHGEKRIDQMELMIEKLKFYIKKDSKSKGLFYKGKKIADAGFVINLPHRTDRKESVIKLLNDLHFTGYEFFDGVQFKNPEFKKFGCTQSYINIFEKSISNNYENILIFEDDIQLMSNVTEEDLDRIFNEWDTTKSFYDVIALGTKLLPRTKIFRKGPTHGYFEEMLCTQSLFFKKNFIEHTYKQLKNFLDPTSTLFKCTIDMFFNDCSSEKFRFVHSHPEHKKFDFGITVPMIFTQSDSFSDNENEIQKYSEIMEKSYHESLLVDKAFLLYGNETYIPILENTINSIREFSNLPIVVYLLNSDKKINSPNVTTIRWDCNIRNQSDKLFYDHQVNENFYIDRNQTVIYDTLIQRVPITKHALNTFAKTICYVDGDSVVLPNIEEIFKLYPEDCEFPYFTQGVYDWMIWDGRGGTSDSDDLSTTLEYPICKLFDIDQSFRLSTHYRQTGYFLAGQNTFEFLNEWDSMCNNPTIKENPKFFAAYHEETIVNCLLWKRKIKDGLPHVYVNGNIDAVDLIYSEDAFVGTPKFIKDWVVLPSYRNQLFFIHGEKRQDMVNKMINKIKEYEDKSEKEKLKILFLAPHLSTGGMPAFLLKRIETIQKYCENVEIFVVEYSDFSPVYVVQKNRIKNILDEKHFFTLGGDKMELMDIIKNNKIDIVHIEEMVEGFESFNQIPLNLMNELYSNDRTWKMVETCHNIWFNPVVSKKLHPDAYAFCSPHHQKNTFSTMPSYGELFEFPIDNNLVDENEKLECKKKLGLDLTKKHIVNVGLWTPGKNQGEGIEIARLLSETNPELEFHFVGNQAPNFQDFWLPIMENLPNNVKVWGERDDVSTFMKAADIFLFNSTWECNPLVIREAISYGLKILSRNLPQYLDMFTPYITPIDSDIQKTSKLLVSELTKGRNYIIPENQSKMFAEKHLSFYKKVSSFQIRKQNPVKTSLNIYQHFVNNPFLEIRGDSDSEFEIYFYDENNKLGYYNKIKSNHWIKLNREYYTKWRTEIYENGTLIYNETLNFEDKRVLISLESKSLGDTLAWFPYMRAFQEKHKCKVIVSTFWNQLFKENYQDLEFVEPGSNVDNLHGLYRIGWFWNSDKEPETPQTIPLQKAATNILGLDYEELIPDIVYKPRPRPYLKKYVTIATNSTSGCKFWEKSHWQEIINYLHEQGYKVVNVSKERNSFNNAVQIEDTSMKNTINTIHHSEFFIGLSSGLSWLAWALKKHVIMISNFSEENHEFQKNCTRLTNTSVCHGCWNNPEFIFDKGDWNWCPLHKGTERQFECQKSITAQNVINQIQKLLI